jgi:hypothetical protein
VLSETIVYKIIFGYDFKFQRPTLGRESETRTLTRKLEELNRETKVS